MNNIYKTNFDLSVTNNKVFRYNILKVDNNKLIGMCYVTNYKQMFELALNCSYQVDNINAYVDEFYIILKDENLYHDIQTIINIWKQKAPLVDNIGFVIDEKIVYQANQNDAGWFVAYVKPKFMSLLKNDEHSQYGFDDQKEQPSLQQRFDSQFNSRYDYQPESLNKDFSLNNDRFNDINSTRFARELNNQKLNSDFNSFDNKYNSFNSSFDSFNNSYKANKYDTSFNNPSLNTSASHLNDSIDSLRQRMSEIDRQINDYQSITNEINTINVNNDLGINLNNKSFDSYDEIMNSATINMEEYGINPTTSINNTEMIEGLNSYEFDDSTKGLLLHHSDDFND
ncbi:hypothetical protein [Mycoplasma sp. E35C]|uniref:hypothetical protein n=1 Tax=Mycoplasma sp. E35C TaxID=2801918 RepID=UPI001CA3938E|nr:hypothetical protein [Mycoplasma sp. E35C]QZX49352.1 hypothetical protein JJE79_01210 [Mycoplasma sp. E35C]